jgi:hypothetical protein
LYDYFVLLPYVSAICITVFESVDLQVTAHNLRGKKPLGDASQEPLRNARILEDDEFVGSIREGLINPAAYLNAHKLVAFVTMYPEKVIILFRSNKP